MNKPFNLKHMRAVWPNMAELLERDLAEHFGVSAAAPETNRQMTKGEAKALIVTSIKGIIDNHHPARGFTYAEIAELVADIYKIDISGISGRTWVAHMRDAGLRKLGVELTTLRGEMCVYCRAEDAGELSQLTAYQMRKEMSPGVCAEKFGRGPTLPKQPTVGGI